MNNVKFNEMVTKVKVTGGRYWYKTCIGELFNVIGVGEGVDSDGDYYKVEHPDNGGDNTYIVHTKDCEPVEIRYNNERYCLEERKAKKGEKIILINYKESRHAYVNKYPLNNGDVFTTVVVDSGGYVWGVEEREYKNVISPKEYRVLVPIAEPSKTASALTANVTVSFDEKVIDMLTSLSQEVVNLRYEVEILKQKKPDDFPVITTESVRETINKMIVDGLKPKPAQAILTRADVVAKAKADVESLKTTHYPTLDQYYTFGYRECDAEFIVNREKRTVVCLLRDRRPYGDKTVYSKGIARCTPDDVFHIEIGRAIALRRALGLSVPEEYVNAPKPEGVAIGDVVYLHNVRDNKKVTSEWVQYALTHQIKSGIATVIDDSDREGACC